MSFVSITSKQAELMNLIHNGQVKYTLTTDTRMNIKWLDFYLSDNKKTAVPRGLIMALIQKGMIETKRREGSVIGDLILSENGRVKLSNTRKIGRTGYQ